MKLMPLSGESASLEAAEEYRLWDPGRALRRSSIMRFEGAIPSDIVWLVS